MRRLDESIIIDSNIRVTVVSVKGDKVRLGIEAPPEVRIDRQEIHERRIREDATRGSLCVGS
jgi:carbon storage regulator